MPQQSLDILVAPGTTPLGREVCRLGRAAGHEMTSLSREGRPTGGDSWLHGVAWSTGNPTEPGELASAGDGASAVILLPPDDERQPAVAREHLRDLLTAWEQAGVDRVVYVTAGHTDEAEPPTDEEQLVVEGDAEGGGGRLAVRLPVVDETADVVEPSEEASTASDRRCPPIPVGQAAMAVLRIAAEPDRAGTVSCREATELGHAVMIQQ